MKKHLVVLTGAGISADSGIKTFRDSDGLWEGYRIEEVATPGAWRTDPRRVLDFYNERRKNIRIAEPNAAHTGLAELEQHLNVSIITQNIDGLHQRAGSRHVLEVHGSFSTLTCIGCFQQFDSAGFIEPYLEIGEIPR